MSGAAAKAIALVVRQPPYAQRSARTQLDVALAAASLELPLEIYFLGDSLWQLATQREPGPAGLARGLKAWSAVSDMTRVGFYADARQIRQLQKSGVETIIEIEGIEATEMASRWRSCLQVVTL